MAYEKIRDGGEKDQKLVAPEPYNTLRTLASQGKIHAIVGGPNCRTWSILRWFPKPKTSFFEQGLSGDGFSTFSKPRGPCCQSWQPTKKGRAERVLSCLLFFFT